MVQLHNITRFLVERALGWFSVLETFQWKRRNLVPSLILVKFHTMDGVETETKTQKQLSNTNKQHILRTTFFVLSISFSFALYLIFCCFSLSFSSCYGSPMWVWGAGGLHVSLLACENAEGISRGNRGDILNILGRQTILWFKMQISSTCLQECWGNILE